MHGSEHPESLTTVLLLNKTLLLVRRQSLTHGGGGGAKYFIDTDSLVACVCGAFLGHVVFRFTRVLGLLV